MEFILNLLAFLFTDAEIQEIKDTKDTWYTVEEIAESNRLHDLELKENLEFLDTLLK